MVKNFYINWYFWEILLKNWYLEYYLSISCPSLAKIFSLFECHIKFNVSIDDPILEIKIENEPDKIIKNNQRVLLKTSFNESGTNTIEVFIKDSQFIVNSLIKSIF